MVTGFCSILPHGPSPKAATSAAGFQLDVSYSGQAQRSPASRLDTQDLSIGTTNGSPLAKNKPSCPINPAGEDLSPPFVTSTPITFAPGFRRPVTSGLSAT